MKLAIAGSKLLLPAEALKVQRTLKAILSCYGEEDELHHTNQNGVEQVALHLAKDYRIKVKVHSSKAKRWSSMPAYQARALQLIENSDRIVIVYTDSSGNSPKECLFLYQPHPSNPTRA